MRDRGARSADGLHASSRQSARNHREALLKNEILHNADDDNKQA